MNENLAYTGHLGTKRFCQLYPMSIIIKKILLIFSILVEKIVFYIR